MANTADASTNRAFAEPSPSETTSSSVTGINPVPIDHKQNGQVVSAEEIRLAAYLKWEAAGKPDGDGLKFWSEAEQELLSAT